MTKHTFKIGDVVSLKGSEPTLILAKVNSLLDDDGALQLDTSLSGTRFWNEQDLNLHRDVNDVDIEVCNAIQTVTETYTDHPIFGDGSISTLKTTDGQIFQLVTEAYTHQKLLTLADRYENIREDDRLTGNGGQCQDVDGTDLVEFIKKNPDWVKQVLATL